MRKPRIVMRDDQHRFLTLMGQLPARLTAEMRSGGRIVGVSDALFNDAGDHVVSSQLVFPAAKSRFSFTVDSLTNVEAFGPETWIRP